ncbi:DUF4268 domain-containing protein, partial [Candidatus Dojkabacteria bacterium]|nr:DUF4268 domain-containing protein [Candidatus Dojkabacteria bacterium]
NSGSKLSFRQGRPQHWYDGAIGSSLAHLSLTVNSGTNKIGAEVYIPDNKDLFQYLHDQKDEIENSLQEKLDWMELPNKKASRIKLRKKADFNKREEWESQH